MSNAAVRGGAGVGRRSAVTVYGGGGRKLPSDLFKELQMRQRLHALGWEVAPDPRGGFAAVSASGHREMSAPTLADLLWVAEGKSLDVESDGSNLVRRKRPRGWPS